MPSIEHDHDRLSFPSNSDKTLTPRQHYGRPGFEHCTGTSKVHFPEKRKSLPLPPVSNFSNDLTDKRAKQDSQIVGEDRFIQQYSGQAFGFRRTFQPGRRITPPNTRPLEIVDLTHSAEKPKSTGIWPYDCSLSSLSSPQDRYNVSEFQQASMNANMPRQGACGSTSSRTHFDRSDQGSQRTETVRIDGQREYKSQVPPRVLDNSFSTLSEKGHTSAQGYAPQHFPATHQVQGELLRAPDIQTQHSYFLPSNSQFFSLIKPSNTSSYSSPHRPLPVKRSSDQEYGDVGRRFVENDLHQQSAFQFNRGVSSHASLNGYSMEERGGHRDLSGSMVMPSTVEGDRHGHHTLEVVRDVHNRSLPPASGNYHDAMDIDGYGRRLYKAA
ncbi:hypothetical protein M501DRAFT_837077 [Patellaria atrata CBS 101060]|uniref:Uncharacterized protein n=1 Tax=Patellaria atrata CBS 101060 TaxID=1346257 RepID=A0A9P4VPI4_9PEZI|nr:hypothetical protein M501DRAFT_837077 [Patellaria atrata CBS 101060]